MEHYDWQPLITGLGSLFAALLAAWSARKAKTSAEAVPEIVQTLLRTEMDKFADRIINVKTLADAAAQEAARVAFQVEGYGHNKPEPKS